MIKVKRTGSSCFGKVKNALPLAAALLCAGCISFQSGNKAPEKNALKALREDKTLKPFSEIQVSWQNLPFRNPTDAIGEGSVSNPPKYGPVPIGREELKYFRLKAVEILTEAGLYDPKNGSGTLKLGLATSGRWTYHDLFKFYLVDTMLIFILPSTISSSYTMTAEFPTPSGTQRTVTTAFNKTTFHLLLAPLYPFFPPGAKRKSLIQQMLRQTSVEIHEKMKHPDRGTGDPDKQALSDENQAPPAPPMPPSRTWIPKDEAAPDAAPPGSAQSGAEETPDD